MAAARKVIIVYSEEGFGMAGISLRVWALGPDCSGVWSGSLVGVLEMD